MDANLIIQTKFTYLDIFLEKAICVIKIAKTKENMTYVTENQRDTELCIGYKSQDEKYWRFVFKKKDKDGEGTKSSGVFSGDIVSQDQDNFILLMCQYHIFITI